MFVLGCGPEDAAFDEPFLENPVFPGSSLITVKPYEYHVDDVLYQFRGSELSDIDDLDIFPPTPLLRWEPTGASLVAAAIFDDRIIANDVGIFNVNNIVWMWHSGLNTSLEGSISYSEGRSVINGNLLPANETQPLVSGKTYFWVVWAWDESGTEVKRSTQELGFIVE